MLAVTKCSPRRQHDRLVDRLRDALGDADRLVRAVELLADDEELVAAEPRDRVAGAHRVVQPRRQRDEQLVARLVAERVVDELELVEVGEQHRDRAAVAAPPGERALEPVERERAVGQAGERVVQRAVADLLLDAVALDRAGDDVRDRAQEVGLVGRERGAARARARRARPTPRRARDRHRDAGARAGVAHGGDAKRGPRRRCRSSRPAAPRSACSRPACPGPDGRARAAPAPRASRPRRPAAAPSRAA